MARIRTIKPDFWRDDGLSEVSPEAALLAIGLLNISDDYGYFKANPKLIEADIFPLRELSGSTTTLLRELLDIGYIQLFDGSDGKKYGHVVNFLKHQVINKKTNSQIKELVTLQDDYRSTTVVLPTGKERKGKEEERKGKEIVANESATINVVISESESAANEISNYLHDKILSVNEKARLNPKSWITDIEKAVRIDNRTKVELISIIDWIYSHNGSFWIPNIMSGKKLREKFDTMQTQKNQNDAKIIAGGKNAENKGNNQRIKSRREHHAEISAHGARLHDEAIAEALANGAI